MQKRQRNKVYYKVEKKHNYLTNELLIYKNFVPESMLDSTFVVPVRIIDLSPHGATIRDTLTGVVSSKNLNTFRKLTLKNF
jgi:hypothetical protein